MSEYIGMRPRHLAQFLGAAAVTASVLVSAPVPSASAAPCPDVEVVFARGTTEPPGVGGIGQDFVSDVRAQAGAKSVGVYAVQYPASTDFPTAVQGINDASAHIQSMAATCPNTKMVLGGYSQGAAVIGFVTANAVPAEASEYRGNGPMPPEVADHVAAVALFGKPSPGFMNAIGAPAVDIGPLYTAKTLDSCVPRDPVCSNGRDMFFHGQYVPTGLVDQAATFAVSKL